MFCSFLNDMEGRSCHARTWGASCSLHGASGRQFHLRCLTDTEVPLRCKRTAVALRTVGTQQLGPMLLPTDRIHVTWLGATFWTTT